MPITLANTRITVEFQGGDPKGDSWVNPFTLDDIVAASVAGSWDPAVTKQGIQYLIPYSLYIINTDTHFLAEDSQVYFEYNDNVDSYRLWVLSAHFKSQGNIHGMSWAEDYVYGKTSLYISSPDGHIENTKFSQFRSVNFYGGAANNLIIKKSVLEACGLIALAANAYVEVENISVVNPIANATWQSYDFARAENVTFIDCPQGIYMYIVSTLNIRGLKMIDVATHFRFRPTYEGQVVNCIDSNVDVSSYDKVTPATGDNTANNISTFKINITDGDSGTAKLYDKDNNLIFSEVLSGELEKEVLFEMMEVDAVDGEWTKELLTTYEPFKLVISKSGYMDLTIPDIMVNPGSETHIFAKMVVPIYYQQSISGSVSEDAVSGTVKTAEVSGTIN